MTEVRRVPDEPQKVFAIDAEYLSGQRMAYQETLAEIDDVDLMRGHAGRRHQLAGGRDAAGRGRGAGGL